MEPESEKDERKVQAEIETKKEGVNTKQRQEVKAEREERFTKAAKDSSKEEILRKKETEKMRDMRKKESLTLRIEGMKVNISKS